MRPSIISQKSLRSLAGDDMVLFVHPNRVQLRTDTKWPVSKARLKVLQRYLPSAVVNLLKPSVKAREPFIIPNSYFGTPYRVTETPKYLKIKDFIQHSGHVEDTIWFNKLVSELRREGTARHKRIVMRNVSDIHDFFGSYVTPLIESLRNEGFKPDETGYESSAVVDAEGHLTKVGSGNHRFAICKVLGLANFPLRVVAVHEDWYAREVMPKGDSWASLQTALAHVAANHK